MRKAVVKETRLYRVASVVFVLFAAGHTFGFLNFKPPTPEAAAVRESMMRVHFHVGASTFSYGGFYVGFGLTITAYLLLAALLTWHLGGVARTAPGTIGALGCGFFALQLVCLVLCWVYFSAVPAALSAFLAVCLGSAAWITRSHPETGARRVAT